MYESFYGFKEKPFNITPDPRFLYLSKTHKEALAQLIYGVKERKGFIVLSGEVGTGKTTIVRALLERLDENCQVAYIFNTKLSVVDFLKYVCHDFGLKTNGDSKIDYLIKLHDFLIESHNDGKTATLIVDEAQNLEASLFEEIRMLTNLETSTQKLLQIFLVGQPELNDQLEQAELWQLKQRISTRHHLLPLDRQETKEYIHTRMRIAGAKRLNCFSEGAIQKIYEYSGGIPRLINNLCDNSLLMGYAMDAPVVNEKIVRECGTDLRLGRPPERVRSGKRVEMRTEKGKEGRRSFLYASLIALLVAIVAVGVILFLSDGFGIEEKLLEPFGTVQPLSRNGNESHGEDLAVEQTGSSAQGGSQVESESRLSTGLLRDSIASGQPTSDNERVDPGFHSNPGSETGAGLSETVAGEESLPGPETTTEARSHGLPTLERSVGPRIVVATEGDTVSQIIFREFGRVDAHLLGAVRKLNPEIANMNRISVGQRIKLPADPEEAYRNPGTPSYFAVHLASFKSFRGAEKLFDRLMAAGEKPTLVVANAKGRTWYRVTIGEYTDPAKASRRAKRLLKSGQYTYAKPLRIPDLGSKVK